MYVYTVVSIKSFAVWLGSTYHGATIKLPVTQKPNMKGRWVVLPCLCKMHIVDIQGVGGFLLVV